MWVYTRRAVRSAPGRFPDPLADYLSDAALGLLEYVRRTTAFTPGRMYARAGLAVRRAVWASARRRSWAGRSRTEKRRTVERVRSALARELGRDPTRGEVVVRLAGAVTRPAAYARSIDGDERTMVARSQLGGADDGAAGGPAEPTDPTTPAPGAAMVAAETWELALRPLAGTDREILRLLVDGGRPVDVAAAVGLSRPTFFRRLNAIRWESRARPDLAAQLGVEPGPPPPPRVDGHYPWFKPLPLRAAV